MLDSKPDQCGFDDHYNHKKIMGVNRVNKRKCKSGCGCKLCKPYKGKYAHQFSRKTRDTMNNMDEQINEL